jgi:hypothetical protein
MIFEIGSDTIQKLELTSFGAAGLKERGDPQRLLRDRIDVVAPDVFVIGEESGKWRSPGDGSICLASRFGA